LFVWRVGGVHECVLGGLDRVSGVFRVDGVGGLVPWGVRVGVGCCGGVWFYVSNWKGYGRFVEGLFNGLVRLVKDDSLLGVLEGGRWVLLGGLKFSSTLCDVVRCGDGGCCFLFVLNPSVRPGLRGWVCEVFVAVREDCLGEVWGWLSILFNIDQSQADERRVLRFREIFEGNECLGGVGGAVVGSVDVLRFLLKPRGRVRVVRTPLSLNIEGNDDGLGEKGKYVVLGDVLDFLEEPVGFKYRVRLGHLHGLIVGSSGAGKSTSAGRFAIETARLGVRTDVLCFPQEGHL